jgi:hypothetical protein
LDVQQVLLQIHVALGDARVAHALIGLKVQSSYNDPSRRYLDLADIDRLLRSATVDLARVREYFRLFDREKELDALLSGDRGR